MVPSKSGPAGREAGLIAQLRRGALEYCVLALLEGGERYGFDLGEFETTWRESPAGPPRRYYRLTPSGRQALKEFRQEWIRFRDGVDRVVSTT